MEERERSLTDEKMGPPRYDGNDTIQSHETTKAISHAKEEPLPESTRSTGSPTQDDDPLPVSSQPGIQPATYVVQVPKDLIYRVPPPEHALMLAERHAHHQKKQKGSYCFSCQFCRSFFPFGRSRRKESAPTQKPHSDI